MTRLAPTLVGIALVVALAACAAPLEPTPTPTEPAPIFATDEEALAAGERALTAFYDVLGEQGERGGDAPGQVATVTVEPAMSEHVELLKTLADAGWHIEGRTTYYGVRLVERSQEDATAHVTTHVCVDGSATSVRDADGNDRTITEWDPIIPMSAEFVSAEPGSATLLLKEITTWTGEDFC